MTKTYLDAAKIIGGLLIGGLMVFSFQVGGQTITVSDDGVSATSSLQVVISETKSVSTYSGTLDEINRNLTEAYREKDRLNGIIAHWEGLKVKVELELNKLPARIEPELENI